MIKVDGSDELNALRGKKIFLTGHTGFTGSWVAILLDHIGAEVVGFALNPKTHPNLYEAAEVTNLLTSITGDIRNYEELKASVEFHRPDYILHLAAQPLVRASYTDPIGTFETNSQGTANVLEVSRTVPGIKGVLCVTTDKVYKNDESGLAFCENDELGGIDPYSASKSAAELIIASYRRSFSRPGKNPVIAVARGGNIIGGGDWSADRLIPDVIRAAESGSSLSIRWPNATRPWQHVIALVEGYLSILARIEIGRGLEVDRAFNLGPVAKEILPVGAVVSEMQLYFPSLQVKFENSDLHEAQKLTLDSTLARNVIGWAPRWDTIEVIRRTADWYQNYLADPTSARSMCVSQMADWFSTPKISLSQT